MINDPMLHRIALSSCYKAMDEHRESIRNAIYDNDVHERQFVRVAELAAVYALQAAFEGDLAINTLRSENEELKKLLFSNFQVAPPTFILK